MQQASLPRRVFTVVMAVVLAVAFSVPAGVLGTLGSIDVENAYAATVVKSWEIGSPNASDVIATLYSDGTFKVTGSGDCQELDDSAPWYGEYKGEETYAELIKTIEFANDVTPTTISHWFDHCINLTTVKSLPSSVKRMSHTFDGCYALASVPTLPASLKTMNSAFSECESLTTAPLIPDGVEDLESAFYGCNTLATLPAGFTIPEGSDVETDDMFGLEIDKDLEEPERGTVPEPLVTVARTTDGSIDAGVIAYDWEGDNRILVSSSGSVAASKLMTISDVSDVTWTGKAITPSITVTSSSGKTLAEGSDYSVTYLNNTDVGTATIVVNGLNTYSDVAIYKNFKIKAKYVIELSSHTVAKYVYDGKKHTVSKSVIAKKLKGIPKNCYTIGKIPSSKKIGLYYVTITGIASKGCTGKESVSFIIVPRTPKITSLKAGKKSFTVKTGKQKNKIAYYIIYYRVKGKKTWNEEFVDVMKKGEKPTNKALNKTIKGLKSGKTYQVRLGAMYWSIFSDWSKIKTVKVK